MFKQSFKEKFSDIKSRWKKAVNTDNIIDFSVDVGLIAFDVLSSPILIVVRIIRFYFKKFVNKYLKRFRTNSGPLKNHIMFLNVI